MYYPGIAMLCFIPDLTAGRQYNISVSALNGVSRDFLNSTVEIFVTTSAINSKDFILG